MNIAACRVLCAARQPLGRYARSAIAVTRQDGSHRRLHSPTTPSRSTESSNEPKEERIRQIIRDEPVSAVSSPASESQDAPPKDVDTSINLQEPQQVKSSRDGRGSLSRKVPRSRVPRETPALELPLWFLKRNVKCYGELQEPIEAVQESDKLKGPPYNTQQSIIDDTIFNEICASLLASLRLRPPWNIQLSDVCRPDLVLWCPQKNGLSILDPVVEAAASATNADLIKIDASDLSEILGDYLGENVAWSQGETALLSYHAHDHAAKIDDERETEETNEKDQDDEEEEEERGFSSVDKLPGFGAATIDVGEPLRSNIMSMFSRIKGLSANNIRPARASSDFLPSQDSYRNSNRTERHSTTWQDLKMTGALNTLIDAATVKRKLWPIHSESREPLAGEKNLPSNALESSGVIIQIHGYREIASSTAGQTILDRLNDVIKQKWQDGGKVTIIGTTAMTESSIPSSRDEIREAESDLLSGERRTIYVPSRYDFDVNDVFAQDESSRISRINSRHLKHMLTSLLSGSSVSVPENWDIQNLWAVNSNLDDAMGEKIWDYHQVHRLATMLLGIRREDVLLENMPVTEAWELLGKSDVAKLSSAVGRDFAKGFDVAADTAASISNPGVKKTPAEEAASRAARRELERSEWEKEFRKSCNPYEAKLLSGVINPADINTTFDDVHAPVTTKVALKTLTSLSLSRPEAFSYGVLATDKIPGVLLYGPPGTGKTLLARAVAKQSGAAVLDVSAGDIYDKWVGEGEKNVKAVFSLARKLAPCVVFVDEADALFAARSSSSSSSSSGRASRRELINQFLREWDGMKSLSAFIMVATNRPFDLDDAVLRRLPRRILVDLPGERDRAGILAIHLKDERLAPDVSLAEMARATPFYSGSDLKNVCVAAALACVLEEIQAAEKTASGGGGGGGGGDGDSKTTTPTPTSGYPPRRTLEKRHFDTAMQEISASINEDMSSLAAIRRFDEKYGDRKGRPKKAAPMGFGMADAGKSLETGRVRKLKEEEEEA